MQVVRAVVLFVQVGLSGQSVRIHKSPQFFFFWGVWVEFFALIPLLITELNWTNNVPGKICSTNSSFVMVYVSASRYE